MRKERATYCLFIFQYLALTRQLSDSNHYTGNETALSRSLSFYQILETTET